MLLAIFAGRDAAVSSEQNAQVFCVFEAAAVCDSIQREAGFAK